MSKEKSTLWMSIVGVIALAFGIFYGIFGLDGLPVYDRFVPKEAYTGWSDGLYGSIFIGFGVLLLLIGRRAFQTGDAVLMKILLYGINSWLIVEALFSFYYGVYFNIGVDIALSAFLSFPLIKGIRSSSNRGSA